MLDDRDAGQGNAAREGHYPIASSTQAVRRSPHVAACRSAPACTNPASDGGETTAISETAEKLENRAPSSRPSPKGARAAKVQPPETADSEALRATDDTGPRLCGGDARTRIAGVTGGGQQAGARKSHIFTAAPHEIDHGQRAHARKGQMSIAVIDGEGGHVDGASDGPSIAAPLPSPLDASPLVQEIVETWRRRQAFVEARRKLILQGRALCRRMTGGDKAAADVIYDDAASGADPAAALIVGPMLEAQAPLTREINAADRHMVKLAKRLPVAEWAAAQKGFGIPGLSKTVGELGDLSAYAKGHSGVWKRAGLAVIDGGRQRKVAGDAALLHGYAPGRRSTFWNIAAAVLKGQGKNDEAGPYRRHYDARKLIEVPRTDTAGHAHNRAMRWMTKRLLRDLHREWTRVSKSEDGL